MDTAVGTTHTTTQQARRRALVAVCAAGFAFSANYTNHAPMIAVLRAAFGFDQAGAGLLTTGVFLTHALMQVPGGRLADRLGPVRVLAAALAWVSVGNLAIAFAGDAGHPCTVYDYTPNRSRDGTDEFLQQHSGYPQAYAYSDCNALYKEPARGVMKVACWPHARRKFEAQSSDLMRSTVMLAYVGLPYEVEREAGVRGTFGAVPV